VRAVPMTHIRKGACHLSGLEPFAPGGLSGSKPEPTWGGREGWVAKPARDASSDIHWLNDACWLPSRGV
jgi:hypothetical protein